MKRLLLALGMIFVLTGTLSIVRDYHSRAAVSCAIEPVTPVTDLKVLNVTNDDFVRGFVLAFEAPLESSNITVLDPETKRSMIYRKEGQLYLPVKPPLPFSRFWVKGLGNRTIRIYWQNPFTTVVLDTPEFKPIPGGFVCVQTVEYPLWAGIYVEIRDPRGVIEISPNGTSGIILTNGSLKVTSINKTLLGTPRLLRLVYSPDESSKLWLDGYVEIDGRRIGYTCGIPVGRDELLRINRGFRFSSMLRYARHPLENETGECTRTHDIEPEGPLLLFMGIVLILAGIFRRG